MSSEAIQPVGPGTVVTVAAAPALDRFAPLAMTACFVFESLDTVKAAETTVRSR